ncbi:LOG family protein [Paraburkholderia sp. HP33-1]|uniref:LOG family protein n=1 Tax=Paraburkholderia sp. HP33-1 TaxID=2883243 RepID=UPI001F1FE6F6|nr:LOG family protein [Paraburkholderia sp. HP33-1]
MNSNDDRLVPASPGQMAHPGAKPGEEEGWINERLRAIMQSPSYSEADRDADFLQEDEARGVRLQLDYMKAEHVLRAHGIDKTIVIFGSTRLREPAAARRELAQAQCDAAAHRGNAVLRRALRVAEHRVALSRYYDVGRELGRLVGLCGNPRLAVLTGGGPGGMEAANRGAFDVGATSIGLNITLPREQHPNPYLTPGLCMQFHYFAMRKLHFIKRAAALVALPGGFGTLDELFCALTLIQTHKAARIPVVLIGEAYWRRIFDADYLTEVGSIDEKDRELFWYAESAGQAWTDILAWHRQNGSPLLDPHEP